VTDTPNPALTRPEPSKPLPPWELTVERDETLHRDFGLAPAVLACKEAPDWLREKAWETAEETGWWLSYGEGGPRAIRMVPVLMHWDGAYQELCSEFLLDLPAEVKAAFPADVILAEKLANAADTVGFSMDCRLESLESLTRTLARLKDRADDLADPDEDEIEDDENLERSTNHGIAIN
jgi:hypothetical protein